MVPQSDSKQKLMRQKILDKGTMEGGKKVGRKEKGIISVFIKSKSSIKEKVKKDFLNSQKMLFESHRKYR